MKFSVLLLLALATPLASAQARLTLSADTVYYVQGIPDVFLSNTGSQPASLDSLTVSASRKSLRALFVRITPLDESNTLFEWSTRFALDPLEIAVTGVTLAPGQSVLVRIGYDFCIVCRNGNSEGFPPPPDTLRFVSGGIADTLVVDFSRFVSAESAPGVSGLDLRVLGSPARGTAAAGLRLEAASEVRVDVFDALGRRVARLHDGPLPPGETRLAVPSAGWPPGVYIVRAETAGQAASARLVVVR